MSMQARSQQTSSQTSQWIGLVVWGLDTTGTTGLGVSYQRLGVWGLTLQGPQVWAGTWCVHIQAWV